MKLFERERERERGWLGKETINTFPRGNETTWQWSPRIGGEGPVSTIHFAGLNWLRYFESGRALHTVEYGRDPTPRPEILHRQHRVSKRASHSRSRIWWRTCACNTCLCHGLSDYLRRVAHETSLTPLLSLSLSLLRFARRRLPSFRNRPNSDVRWFAENGRWFERGTFSKPMWLNRFFYFSSSFYFSLSLSFDFSDDSW